MTAVRLLAPVLAALLAAPLAACGPAPADGPPPAGPRPAAREEPKDEWISALPADAPPPPAPAAAAEDAAGKDFIEEARVLFRAAACASEEALPPDLDPALVKAHCDDIRPKIDAYRKRYVALAKPFLKGLQPAGLPEKVVYPFGGGDLVTALTTYPDAREITTVSLELCGDPRRIRGMPRDTLEQSLKRVRSELAELYFVDDYSKSETLKKTQRGDIPGELVLFLVGLSVHGYEPVSLRYFSLGPDGAVHYLSEREITESDHTLAAHRKATWWPPDFSESFANAEIRYRPVGAPAGEPPRVHRHIAQNLADEPLSRSPLLRHLEEKGDVAAMTKAASYLLWNDAFSSIRGYLVEHAVFMISDSTGVPPRFASGAGLSQETYGTFTRSLLGASPAHNKDFRKLWDSQPKRKLPFRYGYLSARQAHLLVTKRPPPAQPAQSPTGTSAP